MKRHAAGRRGARAVWGPRITAGLTAATLTAALAACGSSPPGATTVSVTSAAAQVAQTALGPVGYREVGSGPPLVLIMGYAGTMETWEPQFLDTLALHFRVVVFDNAGIGSTRALPSPLTVDAMANQTSALISALGLGRPDVLGWSMGGMIAQALAVLHPGQVRRLVLCATFPGVGTVIPPQAKINDLTNGNGLAVLFPSDQAMAAAAFVAGAQSYADAEAASAGVISAQGDASLAWFHGADAAGRKTSEISAPTLVADGAEDQLDSRVQLARHRPAHPRGEAGDLPRRRARVPVPGGDAVRGHGRVVPVGSGAAGQHGHDPGGVPGRGGGGHRGRPDVGIPAQGAVSAARLVRGRHRPVLQPDGDSRSTGLTSRSPAPSPPSTPGCCRPGRPGRWGTRSRRS